jgi:hypothetical protein
VGVAGPDNDLPWLTLREAIQQANNLVESWPLCRISSDTAIFFNGGWQRRYDYEVVIAAGGLNIHSPGDHSLARYRRAFQGGRQ